MPVFDSLKIILVHIPKTAGESVTEQLAIMDSRLNNNCTLVNSNKSINYNLGKHSTYLEIMNVLGDRNYFNSISFTIIRNPWDQVVSFYEHLRKPLYLDEYRGKLLHPYNACLAAMNLSFVEWVDVVYESRQYQEEMNRKKHPIDHFKCQTHWFCNSDGKSMVDFILHFEHLKNDLAVMGKKIGIPIELKIRKNASKRSHYHDYYDTKSKIIIQDHFKQLVEMFGYKY